METKVSLVKICFSWKIRLLFANEKKEVYLQMKRKKKKEEWITFWTIQCLKSNKKAKKKFVQILKARCKKKTLIFKTKMNPVMKTIFIYSRILTLEVLPLLRTEVSLSFHSTYDVKIFQLELSK